MKKQDKLKEVIPLDLGLKKHGDRKKLQELVRQELEGKDRLEIVSFTVRVALRAGLVLKYMQVKNERKLDNFYSYWLRAISKSLAFVYFSNAESRRSAAAAVDAFATDATDAYAAAAAAAADDVYVVVAYAYDAAAAAYAAATYAAYTYDAAYADTYTYDAYEAYAAAAHAAAAAAVTYNPIETYDAFHNSLNFDLDSIRQNKPLFDQPLWLGRGDAYDIVLPELDSFWHDHLFKPASSGELFAERNLTFFEGIVNIPEQVLELKSAREMQRWLVDYMAGKSERSNTARLILLGNGGSGKTSIVRKLHGDKLNEYEQQTPRVSVTSVSVELPAEGNQNGNEIDLDLWDFGGQVIMHSTHNFFISSRSTYLIACNQRANEQPDQWLDVLLERTEKGIAHTVFVVYTHCDSLDKMDKTRAAPWRRDHALQRKYGSKLALEFYNIDLDPSQTEHLGFTELQGDIEHRAIEEGTSTSLTTGHLRIKQLVEENEQKLRPFISYAELEKELLKHYQDAPKTARKDLYNDLRAANNFGYLFPEQPFNQLPEVEDGESWLDDDFILVNQKHWLTYGVYQLVNNSPAQQNHGLLDDKIIGNALGKGKKIYIKEDGTVQKSKPRKSKGKVKFETLLYDDAGVAVLKRVLVNYRWGIRLHNRRDEILLPLATSLDEPPEVAALMRRLFAEKSDNSARRYDGLESLDEHASNKRTQEDYNYLEIELVNKSSDFFFRLATYLEPHLTSVKHLWRTGAILNFYGDEQNIALFMMSGNTLRLWVHGNNKTHFLQMLLVYANETMRHYPNSQAYASERIDLGNGRYQMISSKLIEGLTSGEDTIEKLKEFLLERGKNVTVNINAKDSAFSVGDHNNIARDNAKQTMTINNVAQQLIDELASLKSEPEKVDEELLESTTKELQAIISEPDDAKKKSMLKKIMETTKNFNAISKASETIAEIAPTITPYLSQIASLF